MTQSNYNCTQAELYAVARTGWNSYAEHLAAFSAMRGYYKASYGIDAKAQIEIAELLPDAQARYAQTEVLRTELITLATKCLQNWQLLKRYISTSFLEAAIKPRLEEAGSLRYEKATAYNWEELKLMNVQATNFVSTHNGALTNGDNMPATFTTTLETDALEYYNKLQEFIDSEEIAIQATETKIKKNNEVHASLMTMFKDGQEIFKTEDAIRKQFVFDSVLSIISGPGIAGIRGTISDTVTNARLANVSILIAETGLTVSTDAEGKYTATPMASGTYTIKLSLAGYQDLTIENHKVLIGTVSTLNLQMIPV